MPRHPQSKIVFAGATLFVLSLAMASASCGASSRANRAVLDVIRATGTVDIEQLTSAEEILLADIVRTEASPCEGDVSLLASLQGGKPCDKAVRALGFIYRRILEGYGKEDVLDQYVARFKQAKPVDLHLEGCPDTGPEGAKVTVTVFSDFECPYCAKTAGLMKGIKTAHPDDVRIVFKHLPMVELHEDAMSAATAAAAAHLQGRFWEMHDQLFALEGKLGQENIDSAASQAGLDMERWREDVESAVVLDIVEKDIKQAGELGLDGTPSIFVDGMPYDEPVKYLDQVIEEHLASAD